MWYLEPETHTSRKSWAPTGSKSWFSTSTVPRFRDQWSKLMWRQPLQEIALSGRDWRDKIRWTTRMSCLLAPETTKSGAVTGMMSCLASPATTEFVAKRAMTSFLAEKVLTNYMVTVNRRWLNYTVTTTSTVAMVKTFSMAKVGPIICTGVKSGIYCMVGTGAIICSEMQETMIC